MMWMTRTRAILARIEYRRIAADMAGRWLGLLFVAVAGAVAVQMAMATGTDETSRATMIAVVVAGLLLIGIGPGLTIGRGRYLAAMILAPVWIVAVSYNGLSALEYFDRYLADAEARTARHAMIYDAARRELEGLRQSREAIGTVRDVATIQADERKAGSDRDLRAALKAEAREAERRDRLDAEIRQAAEKFAAMKPAGGRTGSAHGLSSGDPETAVAQLCRWLTAVTGVLIVSASDLRAILLLILTELGAALVPLAMALASRRKPMHATGKALIPETKTSDPSGLPPRADLADVTLWLNHRTQRVAAAVTGSDALYADYAQWMTGRSKVALSKTKFGAMLTAECGLGKRKAGASWTVHYIGIELRPVQPARRPVGLLAIAGGRAP